MMISMMRASFVVAFVWLTLHGALGVGCAGIDAKVGKHLSRGEFERAREVLDKEGAGVELAQDASPEALRAREQFETSVEHEYLTRAIDTLKLGNARHALEVMTEARKLCPWSERIGVELEERRRVVSKIDAFVVSGARHMSTDIPRHMKVQALVAAQPIFPVLNDSPLAVVTRDKLCNAVIHSAASELRGIERIRPDWKDQFVGDLNTAEVSDSDLQSISARLDSLAAIINQHSTNKILSELEGLLQDPPAGHQESSKPLFDALVDRTRAWIESPTNIMILRLSAGFRLVDRLNWLYDNAPLTEKASAVISAIASKRIDTLSRDGDTAALAWLYLEWATRFGNVPDSKELSSRIQAALTSREQRSRSVAIRPSATIDPIVQRLLYLEFYELIERRFARAVAWTWLSREDADDADLLIDVSNAQFEVPDLSKLPAVNSRFLSHYENVPNPAKAMLESQLNSQRLSVDMAESSYNSAVSSHNIYPTEWSLISVNSARSNYLAAVSRYNSLVNQYNATPSTIREPVHLPYTLYAGTVRAGFSASGSVAVHSRREVVRASVIDEDFVRRGANIDDTTPSNRHNDRLDIDVSVSSQLRRLSRVIAEWSDPIALVLADSEPKAAVSIDDQELRVLRWLDHPAGPQDVVAQALNIPKWTSELGAGFQLPSRVVEVPPIILTQRPFAVQAAAVRTEVLHSTCKVELNGPNGLTVGYGSGAVIGPDGLILTSAHVLSGYDIEVIILEGPSAGRYPAEVVFENSAADVALIRAVGLEATTWLGIRMTEVERGLGVIACGYPSAGSGAVAQAALTEGQVVTPIGEEFGQPRITAEVTVASGSSGGPLIDAATGEIVGVVTAVASNEFTTDRAASGAFCLAAPSSKLTEWLGIKYDDRAGELDAKRNDPNDILSKP